MKSTDKCTYILIMSHVHKHTYIFEIAPDNINYLQIKHHQECFSNNIKLPAIPVKAPTRKSTPGRVHGKNPQKCAHGPVLCTSEVTRAGSIPNNPPMGQLLEETRVSIACVIKTLGTFRGLRFTQWGGR